FVWYLMTLFQTRSAISHYLASFQTDALPGEKGIQPGQQPRPRAEQERTGGGGGSDLVSEAGKCFKEGRWETATDLLQRILHDPSQEKHHEYARNCLKSIQKRLGSGEKEA